MNDSSLLDEALTHSSALHEDSSLTKSYERLEFLGDSILGFLCSEELLGRCPGLNEGQLSRLRASFVSEPSLAQRAKTLEIASHIRMGKGEAQSGGRDRDALLADVMEALIAALYLDQGLAEVQKFLREKVFPEWKLEEKEWQKLVKRTLSKDPKSRLQELFQRNSLGLPTYLSLDPAEKVQGPFRMGLALNNNILLEAEGSSKKEATVRLATSMLAMGPQKIVALLRKNQILSDQDEFHDLGVLGNDGVS